VLVEGEDGKMWCGFVRCGGVGRDWREYKEGMMT